MFEDLKRELQRLATLQQVSVAIPTDAEGYLDRECPSQECQFLFKVFEEDWRSRASNGKAHCPFCGHMAPHDHWYPQQQVDAVKTQIVADVQQGLNKAMKRDSDRWNLRQPHNSFVRITMKVHDRPQSVFLSPMAAEAMRLKITCPSCSCRYAIIGAAFFCPACGHNAADLVFAQSIHTIRDSLDALPAIRTAISDRDIAETTARTIIEHGLQYAITAFQRYAEALYASRYPSSPAPRRNAFQSLVEGSDLWHVASGKRYTDYLMAAELSTLTRYFQQRHLLTHREGIVDAHYISRSGDASYRVGQRLVVREAAVRECLAIIDRLAKSMAV